MVEAPTARAGLALTTGAFLRLVVEKRIEKPISSDVEELDESATETLSVVGQEVRNH